MITAHNLSLESRGAAGRPDAESHPHGEPSARPRFVLRATSAWTRASPPCASSPACTADRGRGFLLRSDHDGLTIGKSPVPRAHGQLRLRRRSARPRVQRRGLRLGSLERLPQRRLRRILQAGRRLRLVILRRHEPSSRPAISGPRPQWPRGSRATTSAKGRRRPGPSAPTSRSPRASCDSPSRRLGFGLNGLAQGGRRAQPHLLEPILESAAWRYYPDFFSGAVGRDRPGSSAEAIQVNPLTDIWDSLVDMGQRQAQRRAYSSSRAFPSRRRGSPRLDPLGRNLHAAPL